ncbi:MAG: hypothetical protein J1D85_08025, partial [Bacteroidales bacterium]|nr:hypothetical protein [Bacteroidales bacterium]
DFHKSRYKYHCIKSLFGVLPTENVHYTKMPASLNDWLKEKVLNLLNNNLLRTLFRGAGGS